MEIENPKDIDEEEIFELFRLYGRISKLEVGKKTIQILYLSINSSIS
jgi:hypothetical protein